MNKSIKNKLDMTCDRFEEISRLLSEPEIINNTNEFRALSKEYSTLATTVKIYTKFKKIKNEIHSAQEMLNDKDAQLRELGREEISQLNEKKDILEIDLQKSLIPQDKHDNSNVFLEIRAGTGGDEAAIFVGDLFRMYLKYSEKMSWSIEIINAKESDQGGFKEIVTRVKGPNVYRILKFESGAHRVQRVPTTESQGRIHTSACTVAILPEPEKVEEITINTSDLRVDTYRASGAGGQHVNKTDSAVRLTHIPTGIVVECQDERSQHKNKARALSLLQAKLLDIEITEKEATQAETRKTLVGSGDRSERIRTYNFPQGRVTDHRINLTVYKLSEILEGNIEIIIEPLINEHQIIQLAALSDTDF